MKMIFTIGSLIFLLGGCVYPNQQVQTVDDRPGISIVGAPSGAILYIDGLEIGPAHRFDGNPNYLIIEPGKHHVEIRQGTELLHSVDIYAGEGTMREISLSEVLGKR